MTDWYRRKTWTKADEEEFFAKLKRARQGSREQYLKIQAMEFVQTKDETLLEVAEMLLNKLLTEYPDDTFNRSSALQTLGNIYEQRQNIEKAIDYYKQAVDFEAVLPKVRTNSYIDFSELVVKFKKTDLYNYAEKIIIDRLELMHFPLEKYKAFSILSIINAHNNKIDVAIHYAELAEQNANAQTSGFSYHKDLGLVSDNDRWLDKLTKRN